MRIACAARAAVSVVLASLAMSGVQAAGNAEAGKGKAAACLACHGPDGNSLADIWPKIAGQAPEYIEKQLHDFKSGARVNEQMSPMAQPLSAQDVQDLAAFFSTLAPNKVETLKAELIGAGRVIYTKGKGRPQVVPACIGCHGPSGGGKADWKQLMSRPPTTLAPALASQHAAYTLKQLQAYKSGERKNDVAHVMRDVAGRLSEADMAAVAEYIASLKR